MTTLTFIELLRSHPDHIVAFTTPDGCLVPPHFHITEVGHLAKSFLDCGGTRHTRESCLLQVWVADDTAHRLRASKLAVIFGRAGDLLPNMELPVEIECEAPVLTQLALTRCDVSADSLCFHTEYKHADCLAKDICLPSFTMPAPPGASNRCLPGSGCC